MADVVGISSRSLSNILDETRGSISLEVCDKIALHGDFSLNEMFEDTIEWAKEHPEKHWPEDYISGARKARGNKESRERNRTKA